MIITLIEPVIKPEKQIYRAPDGTIRIYVGIITNNINLASPFIQRTWILKDKNGVIISTGSVSVKLNTFDSYVDFNDLPHQTGNEIYFFSIDENIAVISTIPTNSLQDIIIVDEFFQFPEPINSGALKVYGNLSVFNSSYIRLPTNWPLMNPHTNELYVPNMSSGFVMNENTGEIYVFVPTMILTHDSHYPSQISYIPFPDLPLKLVDIHVLPVIKKLSSKKYSISPSHRVRVKLYDKEMTETTTFDTPSPVEELSISQNFFFIRIDPLF
jgi:hypothetical protein